MTKLRILPQDRRKEFVMKYKVKQAFIILDGNGDVIDWRDTRDAAIAVAEEMQQDDEDKMAIDKAFEAADN